MSSPVADYVKNNPAPHLVRCCDEVSTFLMLNASILKFRNVVAKEAVRPLDSTLMEVTLVSHSDSVMRRSIVLEASWPVCHASR